MRYHFIFGLLPAISLAAPVEHDDLQFHSLEARQQNLPTIKFPYGTWQASKYDAASDIYVFKNIRFAAPPVGNLRFAKPAPPTKNETLQTGIYGGTCAQSIPPGLLSGAIGSLLPSGLGSSFGSLISGFTSGLDLGKVMGGGATSEDCLFLDLYVPGKALKGQAKLPIVNWIYGGAYILGSKDGMYDGTGIVKASGNNVIYVAGNYRLGAFGFMSGSTVEKEGVPNAGFWDQQAVLQWIQDYASLFGGDASDVSVWGESAGAGSIMHQLTAFGGKGPVLFKKVVIQSPAYDALIDRKGDLEQHFQDFAKIAGCDGKGLACLRALDFTVVKAAQDKYLASIPEGKFGFGPATDGNFVRQLPALELASGNFAKGVESLIISHVADEAAMFVKDNIQNDTAFTNLIEFNFGKNDVVNNAIMKKFPAGKWNTMKQRTHDFVMYSVFTCNVRFITEAYKGKTFNIQYSRGNGNHGTDITPTFYNPSGAMSMASAFADSNFASFAKRYQSYLTSHARTGDVNKYRVDGTIEWPHAEFGPSLSKVLNATDKGFELIEDTLTRAQDCDFWRDAFAALTSAGGYAPPGAVVQSTLLANVSISASKNFQ